MAAPFLTLDVAHPPRPPHVVEQQLMDALAAVAGSAQLRVLKIVHGYGSSGRGGSTRTVVLNWLYRRGGRIKAVIEGESYGIADTTTMKLRQEVGTYFDPDLDALNRGITIVWVK